MTQTKILGEHELVFEAMQVVQQDTCPEWKSGSSVWAKIMGHVMVVGGGPGRAG